MTKTESQISLIGFKGNVDSLPHLGQAEGSKIGIQLWAAGARA